jgi:hypothetical protein
MAHNHGSGDVAHNHGSGDLQGIYKDFTQASTRLQHTEYVLPFLFLFQKAISKKNRLTS